LGLSFALKMDSNFPRTLLLTRWSPTARFAGGEVQRKMVASLPEGQLRWAHLSLEKSSAMARLPVCRGFPAVMDAHWRLKAAGIDYLHKHCVARSQARVIANWVSDFRPQVLWIASDLDGILVGHHLHHLLNIPIHITIYDAFEWCTYCGVPGWYAPFYLHQVRQLLRHVTTLDGMSDALVEHVKQWQPMPWCRGTMVFPPSISWSELQGVERPSPIFSGPQRRIGFCGASRTGPEQWAQFVRALGCLPWRIEVVAFAAPDCFHNGACPENVKIAYQDYQPTELDVVRRLRELGVHACYLGLWREPEKAFFARTSVSSKMTTYAAAGLPIIMDVPEDAAVWGLVQKHGAGIRMTGEQAQDALSLKSLFLGGESWVSLANGARRLCECELDLDKNIEEFKKLLSLAEAQKIQHGK
jgi:hypothetical protein